LAAKISMSETQKSGPWAVTTIVVSMSLVALSNGLMFTYLPVRLAALGFAPWVSGAVVTAMGAGGLVGCFAAGPIIKRVGHARAFAFFAAIVVLSMLAVAVPGSSVVWIAARACYGVAATGLFVVTQSWLNDACSNATRGRVVATFYMTFVLSIGAGAFGLRFIPLDGTTAPLIAAALAAAAMLPITMTRLRAPPPPEAIHIAIRSVWAISPVGLVGLLAVGGLTLLVQGFAPIYASVLGFGKNDVATLFFLMQFGMIAIQLPLGALSDRIDRRYVLIIACVLVIVCGSVAAAISEVSFTMWVLLFALWSGATETIFAVANAHANDRADPQYYVSLSSTLLVAWSVSGIVLPGIATALTEHWGPRAFMYMAIAVATMYALFVGCRIFARDPSAEEDLEPYIPITAQIPHSAELATATADDDCANAPNAQRTPPDPAANDAKA
jgi:MFS family permease